MSFHFSFARPVEFVETDMAGVVHFSNYFRIMEAAEHAFLRSLGFPVLEPIDGERYGWPRVHADCDFAAPLRLHDIVEVELTVTDVAERALSYAFVFRRQGDVDAREYARANMTTVCVRGDAAGGRFEPAPVPAALAARLRELLQDE